MDKPRIDLLVRHDLPSFSYTKTFKPVATKRDSLRSLEMFLEATGLSAAKLVHLLGTGVARLIRNSKCEV